MQFWPIFVYCWQVTEIISIFNADVVKLEQAMDALRTQLDSSNGKEKDFHSVAQYSNPASSKSMLQMKMYNSLGLHS